MGIPRSTQISVPADVLMQELQGEAVLLNVKSGRYFGLDDVGTRMWTALTTSPSVDAAYRVLLNEYDVAADKLERDLQSLLQELVDNGLVEVRAA